MKAVLCIPCRNVAKHLNKIFDNILTLKQVFIKFNVCFYYDESKDSTLELIQNFKIKNNYVEVIINREKLLNYRTHRIAHARNCLIKYVNDYHADTDYIIAMDCDEICSYPINTEVLKYHLSLNSWDALSFNRHGLPKGHRNYDIWALLYEPFVHHCHSYNGDLSIVFKMRKDITRKLNKLKKGELFECYSAFNGFCIYKTKKFIDCKYDGKTQKYFSDEKIQDMLNFFKRKYNLDMKINYECVDKSHGGGLQICEHISFHLEAIRKNNARIRISGERIFDNHLKS